MQATNYAVIDLGTNTFHLLIVQRTTNHQFIEQYRERIFVKLAEEGIERIGDQAFARGLAALTHFRTILDQHQVEQVRAIGTAALRTASNGPDFLQTVQQQTGISIQLIPGQEEARFIHLGVAQAIELPNESVLIMDIGGGSVEFIIADKNGVKWTESFPLGVAVLFKSFHHQDPITSEEITNIHHHLDQQLQPLFQALAAHPVSTLVGASGTFDVLENLLAEPKTTPNSALVQIDAFKTFYQQLLPTSLAERKALATIPDNRIDMIIVAIILIDFIIDRANCQQIIVSAYAMKEGILGEMMSDSNQLSTNF